MNNEGVVVGIAGAGRRADGLQFMHGFMWSRARGTVDLTPTVQAWSVGSADSINNSVEIIGTRDSTAFLISGERFYELRELVTNAPGWSLVFATQINDAGVISGGGWFDGEWHAFLLTPSGR